MKSMLIHISKDALSMAIQAILPAISANSSLRVLSGMYIRAGAEGLTLVASNVSMTTEYKIPVKTDSMVVQNTGEIVVPARYFYEIIRKLEPGLIRLEITEGFTLHIQTGNSRFRLCGMDAAEYPRIQYIDHTVTQRISINSTLLKRTIKQVAFAVSLSEARPVLTGVSLHMDKDGMRVIATDGIRLLQYRMNLDKHAADCFNVVIPGRTLEYLSKMLRGGEEENTEIVIGHKQIQFISANWRVQAALLEGTYPSIDHLIPQTFLSEVIIRTDCLLHAIERIAILAGDCVTLSLHPSHILSLSSKTTDIGDVTEELSLEQLEGKHYRVSFDSKYFRDILRAVDSESLCIKYAGKERPLVIEPLHVSSTTLFLITPVRTQE